MFERAGDRASVLAFQARELGKSVLKFLESRRRELELVCKVAKGKSKFFQQRSRRLEPIDILAKARFIARKLLDLAGSLTNARYRRIAVFINEAEAFGAK